MSSLGICLKRYSVLPSGQAVRRNSHIDIPLEIALPHFIQDDAMFEDSPVFGNFKLCLQSVVCHRGTSVSSGHYVSIVRRTGPETRPANESSNNSGPESLSRDSWIRLDDLAKERVAIVDVEEFLRKESPYLLFYQVQPIEGDPGNIADNRKTLDLDGPPPYTESEHRHSGVTDVSMNLRGSWLGTNGDATDSRKPSQDELAFQHFRPKSNIGANSIPPISDNAIGPSHSPGRAGPAEQSLAVASHGIPRGRPATRNSNNGLSRSLSRFASKLKKDKGDDTGSKAGAAGIDLESSRVSTEVSEAHDETRRKKDSMERHGYQNDQGARSEHFEYAGHAKEKHKPEKPDRQCMLM